jgi:hypothetical protein
MCGVGSRAEIPALASQETESRHLTYATDIDSGRRRATAQFAERLLAGPAPDGMFED